MANRPINVLLVEDSPVVQLLLRHVIDADPGLHVIGTANNGEGAIEFLSHDTPDVVLMDVHMPKMDGFDATRRIMETHPLPIIICSATMRREDVDTTFRALDAGAVAFVDKPVGPGHAGFDAAVQELRQSIRLMSEVKVVKRWSPDRHPKVPPAALEPACSGHGAVRIVAIGASTGGPPVLRTILTGLPSPLPVPVVIVQHIAAGFLEGMADWLSRGTHTPVHLATQDEPTQAGRVYLAPDGFQMGVARDGRILLSEAPPEAGLRPAVSYLFRSVAANFGADAVGVLLTGMGKDGAEELRLMKDRGAITIAQDKKSSVVHGMPGEAIQLDAATFVLTPGEIAPILITLTKQRRGVKSHGNP
jgi:two-component system chemotaxis response regulator CheB